MQLGEQILCLFPEEVQDLFAVGIDFFALRSQLEFLGIPVRSESHSVDFQILYRLAERRLADIKTVCCFRKVFVFDCFNKIFYGSDIHRDA